MKKIIVILLMLSVNFVFATQGKLNYRKYQEIVNSDLKKAKVDYRLPNTLMMRKENLGLYKFHENFMTSIDFTKEKMVYSTYILLKIKNKKTVHDILPAVILAANIMKADKDRIIGEQLFKLILQVIKDSEKEEVDKYFIVDEAEYGVSYDKKASVMIIYAKPK
ncbi:hypothetical protein [Phocoenobacter skyensis]|uniref:Uncharacterized protein n=1 Tax=Phocoenobacter skyensis TaxID=97481 RepID=A0AAJ6NDX1_9PAST|nr:hypothetical protein [Pasteurella skyensis]MDP8174861.1 hypothetical protein [Pasteurella skyensis]